MKFRMMSLAVAVLASAALVSAAELTSGLQAGRAIGPFDVVKVAGAEDDGAYHRLLNRPAQRDGFGQPIALREIRGDWREQLARDEAGQPRRIDANEIGTRVSRAQDLAGIRLGQELETSARVSSSRSSHAE